MKKIQLFIFLFLPLSLLAQEERHGFRFGLNMGMYFPSKISANYYNGSAQYSFSDPNEVRMYSIEERLRLTPQTIATITNAYNASGFHFNYDSYPAAMRYNGAFQMGVQVAFDVNNASCFFMNLNACKVKTVDRFTIVLEGTTQQQNMQEDIRLFQIVGNEQRFNANLGYRTGWALEGNGLFFVQGGGSLLGTKVVSNQVFIANQTYDLIIGAQNPNQIVNYIPRTGIGFGYFIGTGFFLPLGNQFAELSINLSKDKMLLNNNEFKGWNKVLTLSVSI
ncbi:MAG: hypothetical protein FJX90_03165 [Bacteroidetes bacterium]|nr:hypothetical protein [Bacteroidota bacterium]